MDILARSVGLNLCMDEGGLRWGKQISISKP